MIAIFYQPVYLTPLLRRFPLEFCYGCGLEKTRIMPLPDRQKKIDDILNEKALRGDSNTARWL